MPSSPLRRLLALSLGLLVVPASGLISVGSLPPCDYETDPECEDEERGHISGKVLIPRSTSSAASAPGANDPRWRRALARAAELTRTDPVFRQEAENLRGETRARWRKRGPARTPSFGSSPASRREVASSRQERWRAGEIIVRTETPLRGRRAQWTALLDEKAGPGLELEVGLCNTETMCLARVLTEEGKPLAEAPTRDLAARLSALEGVRWATVNRLSEAMAAPNDDYYSYQWHYSAMNLEAAWDITTGSDDVTIAVVDTGVLTNHPDLSARLAGGADLISEVSLSNDGDARDDDPHDPGDNSCGAGCHSYHGSHVAGTIGAVTNNGSQVAGVTWAGRLLGVRVLGQGGQGTNFDIVGGILWAIGEEVDGVSANPDPADVINLSLGGPGEDPAQDEAVQAAIDAGALVLVAAGNSAEDAGAYTPANSPGAITVAAVGQDVDGAVYRTPYSNYGDVVALAAPGGDLSVDNDADGFPDGILSTMGDDADFQQGTSMATPHVAGLAALMKALSPSLRQDDARVFLTGNANGEIDCDGCGAGLVDAARTLLALEGREDEPLITVSPSTLRLGRGEREGELKIRNVGGAAASVTISVTGPGREKISVDQGEQEDLPASGTLALPVEIERGDNETGEATVVVGWNGQTSESRVLWTDDKVKVVELVAVAAVQFPEDPEEEIHVERVVPAVPDDDYAYKLFNLTPGAYLVAGLADENGDEDFDPETEGFGVFPTLSDPVEIEVTAGVNVTEVDFVVAPQFVGDDVEEGDGTSPVGGACQQNSDCQAGLFCDPSLPGGYCTMDCSFEVCPGDGVCFELCADADCAEVYSLCLDGCSADADCREGEGYVCDADNTCFYYD